MHMIQAAANILLMHKYFQLTDTALPIFQPKPLYMYLLNKVFHDILTALSIAALCRGVS